MISHAIAFALFAASVFEPSSDDPLQRLIIGNQRYVTEKALHPNQGVAARKATAMGQSPFAIVLSCSDSRVPPELVFDVGLGDLFVVRLAGNVAEDSVLDSIVFAVKELQVSLIVVLGHERCAAVTAVVNNDEAAVEILDSLVPSIEVAAESTKGQAGDPIENAVKANIRLVEQTIAADGALKPALHSKALRIVGAYYDLDDGHVTFLN